MGGAQRNAINHFAKVPTRDVILVVSPESSGEPCYFAVFDEASGAIVLSIRGTASVDDALTDLCYCDKQPIPWPEPESPSDALPPATAHRGMLTHAVKIQRDVMVALVSVFRARPDATRLVVTGHSMGAGVAVLLTGLFQAARREDRPTQHGIFCYAFASPPVIAAADHPLLRAMTEGARNFYSAEPPAAGRDAALAVLGGGAVLTCFACDSDAVPRLSELSIYLLCCELSAVVRARLW